MVISYLNGVSINFFVGGFLNLQFSDTVRCSC